MNIRNSCTYRYFLAADTHLEQFLLHTERKKKRGIIIKDMGGIYIKYDMIALSSASECIYLQGGKRKKLIRKNRKMVYSRLSLLFSSTCDGEDQWRPRRWRHPAHLRSIRARVVNVTVPSHFAILCQTCFFQLKCWNFSSQMNGWVR